MTRQLTPLVFACALSSCAALAGGGPELNLSAQQQWVILSDASSLDRRHLGDVVITNSQEVLRELETTQSAWARMQSRTIVVPEKAYADIAERTRDLSCAEIPPMQSGRLGVQVSDGRGHQKTCVLVPSTSCEFLAQIVGTLRRSSVPLEALVELRRRLGCSA